MLRSDPVHSNSTGNARFSKSLLIRFSLIMLVFFLVTVVFETAEDHGEKGTAIISDVLMHSFLLLLTFFPVMYLLLLRPLSNKIREQDETKKALQDSETRYRFLADNILDVIFELDSGLHLTYLSPSTEKLTGFRVEEMAGCNVLEFLSPESQQTATDRLQSIIDEHRASGNPAITTQLELQLACSNGGFKWVEVIATLLFDNGGLVRVVGVTRDIDARKSIESALNKAYNLLEKTVSSLNEAVFIIASENRIILQVNSCAESMFGYSAAEMLGEKTSILHINEERHQEFGRMMAESYKSKGYFETTYRLKRKDGSIFHSEHFVRPIDLEDGSCTTHVCVVRDISDRVNAENALKETCNELAEKKAFAESIITNLQSGIIVTDTDLRITMTNPYVQGLCNRPVESFVGKKLEDICPALADQLNSGMDSNELLVSLYTSEFTIGFTRRDLKNAEGETVGNIINFRDLTEIVKIRGKIHQKERLSAMGEVVAGVAHEMRNPLFGMTTVGQILDKELALNPSHRQLMDLFMKESRRLNNLVQDLLDGTRELKLRKSSINLCQVITTSISVSRQALDEKEISIIWTPPSNPPMLLADPEKLEQIFVNLIHNAIDASSRGSSIEIVLSSGTGACSVTVTDSGAGIPENILPNIFDVFFTSKKGGTGMGLYISRNIAEAHNGTLTAVNLPGKGARFTLTLPNDGDPS